MKFSQIFLAGVLLLSISIQSIAGEINGFITDSNSKLPIDGATITINGTPAGTAANSAGRYVLAGLPNGHYNVTYQAIGYASIIKKAIPILRSCGSLWYRRSSLCGKRQGGPLSALCGSFFQNQGNSFNPRPSP